jgi:phosphatidylglycerophosphate synthase
MTATPAWVGPIPNLLTGLRLALAATFPLLAPEYRGAVVLAAGLSDVLDGWIARRFHAITPLGQLLDGIADKAFVLAAVVTLAWVGEIPWWEGLLVMTRDVVVGAIALRCASVRAWAAFHHMRPRWSGKATTLLAFAWFLSLFPAVLASARFPLFLLAAASSAVAAVDYLAQFVRLRPDRHGRRPAPRAGP